MKHIKHNVGLVPANKTTPAAGAVAGPDCHSMRFPVPLSVRQPNPSKSMRIQFHSLGFSLDANLRRWLQQPIEGMRSLTPVTGAAVVLEQRRDDAPAFRAFVSLAVPGPDIHAEARDHTLRAAWLKVITALRRQIERRKSCQQLRQKRHHRHPLTAGRWSGAAVAGRI